MTPTNHQDSSMSSDKATVTAGLNTSTMHTPWLQWIYLALAVCGAIFPWLANVQFIRDYGEAFNLAQFIELANANPAARSLSRDLLIGASAVTIWIVSETRRLQMRGLWIVLLSSLTIAFAFAAPFFLFLRERRLLEISRGISTKS
ncbi:DUF2834 domain-containing protein [Synechococcus sp. Cruz-9H2]|nr:DUF2834 domain-containing protein [Synechococcus sp. Cruz-9H2]MCP9844047.1 DUF2834 domain-containing protein [Synechococcus sp. Edmonson 11F2]MCP9856171.1 DUF2834 domain-containing protein [Synechococcus sp. Cruz-9C9]MCP9863456.1 DUF2834 domain-containing protein [Synechococcus sp. Cruz-7E5]MCP9870518.1 DUF2834 domain-containing protein [Synechococcus sp. Cruz-7B9]